MEYNTMKCMECWMWFLAVGGVIGWAAGYLLKSRGFGIVGDIMVGIAGCVLGGIWIAGELGLHAGNVTGTFLVAFAGAVALVALTRFVSRRV